MRAGGAGSDGDVAGGVAADGVAADTRSPEAVGFASGAGREAGVGAIGACWRALGGGVAWEGSATRAWMGGASASATSEVSGSARKRPLFLMTSPASAM